MQAAFNSAISPSIALDTAPCGSPEKVSGEPADRAAALATLRRAVELGVNFIDTADPYGPHVSEEIIAEALAPDPQGVVIATKGGWERVGPAKWTHNASPNHLESAVEGSLKRLRLDRIDVYQLHIPDPAVSFDASMNTFAHLREQGKIRHVALSNVTLEHLERARKIVPIVSVQKRYSFADREWDYLLDHCAENQIVFIPGPRLDKIDRHTKSSSGLPYASARLPCRLLSRGCCSSSPVMLPIPGPSSVVHLEENVAAATLKLPEALFEELSAFQPSPASLRGSPHQLPRATSAN